MKKLRLVLLISVISGVVSAQSHMALGVFAGTSWYMGDINPSQLFYAPSGTASAIFMYNFTKRWALRNQVGEINLKSAANSTNPYDGNPSHFATSFMQIDSRIEFNFAPFAMVDRKHALSTYVNAGLGGTMPLSGKFENMLTFPFGVGMKYGFSKRIAVGAEWTANKTFIDNLDKIESPGGYTLIHHNDWYTCFGLFIIYKIFDSPADCPAYK
jgi:hypothetical protein